MLCQLQHGPVALTAGGTVEAVRPVVVYPLMVTEVPRQAEGFSAQVAHVALLTVDSHVVAQGHVVGVRFAAEVASETREGWRLETNDGDTFTTPKLTGFEPSLEVSDPVGELVVEQRAGVLVGAGAQVADVRPLVRLHVVCRCGCRRRGSGLHGETGAGERR